MTAPCSEPTSPSDGWRSLPEVYSAVYWLATEGDLPVRDARVRICSDGAVPLEVRGWSATID
ncbi:hypothetical protein ACWGJ2_24275 [Streptomyces sp. NPDC054796]